MKIGKEIRRLRKKKKIRQSQLAKMAGIGKSFLSEIEADKSTASVKTLSRILFELGYKIKFVHLKREDLKP